MSGWYVVPTPVLTITGIDKEQRTQGRIALLSCEAQNCSGSGAIAEQHAPHHKTNGFLSQSLPTLARWMYEGRTERKFTMSGFYRVMRKQQHSHLKWTARCFDRTESGIEALNAALVQFTDLVFVVRSPEFWRVTLPEGYERPPQQESEPDPEQTSLVDAVSVSV